MRFSVGEKAKFVVAIDDKLQSYVGRICEIRAVGPWKAGERIRCDGHSGVTQDGCDYIVKFDNESPPKLVGPYDWQLQKLAPAKEPASMRREQA